MTELASIAAPLFSPRSVAIVGASADPTKHASLAQQHLRRHGFLGEIYPINKGRSEVLGERAFASLRDIGKPVDHVFINVSTNAVRAAVEDAVAIGAPCATILSDGFAEEGPGGLARQQEILDIARAGGLRILGPNSIGLVNVTGRVALSANEVLSLELNPGCLGLISQSGSLMGALVSRGQARGAAFSKVVSVGNEADLGVAELAELLIEDPDTDCLLFVLETIRRPQAFSEMARRAFRQSKPLVVFRLGSSPTGAELAASHTGAISGDGRAIDAFLQDCGVVQVRNFETLFEIPPLLAGRTPSRNRRIAVVTTTGGGAGLVVDKFAANVEVAAPSPAIIANLAARGIHISDSRVIDLTLAGTNAQTYGAVLYELLCAPDYDMVLAVVGSSSQFRPDRAVQPILEAKEKSTKPIAVYLTPQADESLNVLRQNDVAAFRTPEGCADAISSMLNWRAPRAGPQHIGISAEAGRLLAFAPAGGMAPDQASAFVAALGAPVVQNVKVGLEAIEPAFQFPADLRFPVALKIVSPNIQHKTEAGGVALGIQDRAALGEACRRMLETVRDRCPDARLNGFQIEAMQKGLAEAIVGYRIDPCVGPVVVVGAGGVLAELYQDVAVRSAPVNLATANEMIAEVRAFAALRGYRNLPPGDLDALAHIVVTLSGLATATGGRAREVEINPLLVKRDGDGVIAVDAVVIVGDDE